MPNERIVMAYGGSLEASASIPWLAERYGAEVVTVTVDVGQDGLAEIRDRARAAGAVRAHVLDARETMARDYVRPLLAAGVLDAGGSPLVSAVALPAIARAVVDLAGIEHATAIAHASGRDAAGATPVEVLLAALASPLPIVAPVREWGMTPDEVHRYAFAHGIVPGAGSDDAVGEKTLWGRSFAWTGEGQAPRGTGYRITRAPQEAPDEPATVEIDFERGVPMAINGVAMPFVELIASLDLIAGANAIGRRDGSGSRPGCEAPAAVVLHAAHDALQRLVSSDDANRFAGAVALQYAEIVAGGRWFTPLREALDAFVAAIQARVTGVVRVTLCQGRCQVVGVTSPFAPADHIFAAAADGGRRGGVPRSGARPITHHA